MVNSNNEEGIKKEIVGERNEWIPRFATHIDDYLQYSPVAVAYGLDACGISSNDRVNRTAILNKGELWMFAATPI